MVSVQASGGLVNEYTAWLASSLSRYEALAKSLVKHKPEKGRIVESVVKGALRNILPAKYSLGTGFIVTRSGQPSPQLDIVIYDGFNNTPVILEGGTGLFPIECVYGFVEVKTTLGAKAIKDSTKAIGTIRSFASKKRYAGYKVVDDGNGNKIAVDVEVPPEDPPLSPRSFVFALNSTCSSIDRVEAKLKECTEGNAAHVHGLAVLNKDWLICQQPSFRNPRHLFVRSEGRSFAAFCATVLGSIQSMPVRPASMRGYLGLG